MVELYCEVTIGYNPTWTPQDALEHNIKTFADVLRPRDVVRRH